MMSTIESVLWYGYDDIPLHRERVMIQREPLVPDPAMMSSNQE